MAKKKLNDNETLAKFFKDGNLHNVQANILRQQLLGMADQFLSEEGLAEIEATYKGSFIAPSLIIDIYRQLRAGLKFEDGK